MCNSDGIGAGSSGDTRCGEEILRQAQDDGGASDDGVVPDDEVAPDGGVVTDDRAVKGRSGVTVVILAAGFSRRLGRPKQLLDYRGKPLLQWAIDTALAAELGEVLVVLGEAAPAILPRIDLGSASVVINERAIDGQSSSIVAAIPASHPDRSGTLLMLGDQPGLTVDDLQRILAAFDGSSDSIVIASWQGEVRSPVIFGRNYDQELLELTGDTGARPLVKRFREHVRVVDFDRPVPVDIDTEADYQQLLATE